MENKVDSSPSSETEVLQPFTKYSNTLLPQSKTNNFPWHQIKSLFQVNKYKKQIIFGLRGSPFPFKICTNKLSIQFLRII